MRRPRRWRREVAARMAECLTREGAFGNPGSAATATARRRARCVEAARARWPRRWVRRPPKSFGPRARPRRTIWRSSASRSYYRDSGRHIVTARTEHKAVLDPCRELERRGWRVDLPRPRPAAAWWIPAQVAAALRPDTVLVSIMHVNNEIGVVQDIAAIAALCAGSAAARLHVDAAQSVGKCALDFDGARHRSRVVVGAQGLRTQRGRSAWSCPASAAFSCNPCYTAAARSAACAPAPWRRIKWSAWERHLRSQGRRPPRRRSASQRCRSGCGRG